MIDTTLIQKLYDEYNTVKTKTDETISNTDSEVKDLEKKAIKNITDYFNSVLSIINNTSLNIEIAYDNINKKQKLARIKVINDIDTNGNAIKYASIQIIESSYDPDRKEVLVSSNNEGKLIKEKYGPELSIKDYFDVYDINDSLIEERYISSIIYLFSKQKDSIDDIITEAIKKEIDKKILETSNELTVRKDYLNALKNITE